MGWRESLSVHRLVAVASSAPDRHIRKSFQAERPPRQPHHVHVLESRRRRNECNGGAHGGEEVQGQVAASFHSGVQGRTAILGDVE